MKTFLSVVLVLAFVAMIVFADWIWRRRMAREPHRFIPRSDVAGYNGAEQPCDICNAPESAAVHRMERVGTGG